MAEPTPSLSLGSGGGRWELILRCDDSEIPFGGGGKLYPTGLWLSVLGLNNWEGAGRGKSGESVC